VNERVERQKGWVWIKETRRKREESKEEEYMKGGMDGQMGRWMDGWTTDEMMEGLNMDGGMDRRMDG
jgi:hypothetical protein